MASKSFRRWTIATIAIGLCVAGVLKLVSYPKISPTVVVTVHLPQGCAPEVADSLLLELDQAIDRVSGNRSAAFAFDLEQATIFTQFESGTSLDALLQRVQESVTAVRKALPTAMKAEEIIQAKIATKVLVVSVQFKAAHHGTFFPYNFSCLEFVPSIQQIHGIDDVAVLGNCPQAMWIKLDCDRMRQFNLTEDDLAQCLMNSSMVGGFLDNFRLVHKTSQNLDYVRKTWLSNLERNPEAYENVILRANSEGEIVRLKDFGKVDFRPLYGSQIEVKSQSTPSDSATIVVTLLLGADARAALREITKTMDNLKQQKYAPRFEFEISDILPSSRLSNNSETNHL